VYLILAYRAAGADVLVTTDDRLRKALEESDICWRSRDEFLDEYLSDKG